MKLGWIDWTGLLLIAGLLQAAVVVFLKIQRYLGDPLRCERNEQWFEQFEKNQREHYRDRALRWRVEDLGKHFHREH